MANVVKTRVVITLVEDSETKARHPLSIHVEETEQHDPAHVVGLLDAAKASFVFELSKGHETQHG